MLLKLGTHFYVQYHLYFILIYEKEIEATF